MLEHVNHTLTPWVDDASRVLVLGTMPSPKSRARGMYYGHPQNRFWPTLAALWQEDVPRHTRGGSRLRCTPPYCTLGCACILCHRWRRRRLHRRPCAQRCARTFGSTSAAPAYCHHRQKGSRSLQAPSAAADQPASTGTAFHFRCQSRLVAGR